MGRIMFSCITPEDDCVRVVYPDGHVDNLSRTCSVYELLLGNPDYFVCGCTPYTLTNRMAEDEQLEKGFTYFVCASPNAQPFLEPKKAYRGSRILPRFPRHGVQGRELRSPSHTSNTQSRKVFDLHAATMQLESFKSAGAPRSPHHHLAIDRPPKHLKLVFFRHCLQSLRLPGHYGELLDSSLSPHSDKIPEPAPAMTDEVHAILKSAARSELGIHVSRRQEFYLRRARRRRRTMWKPVLQSISETMPVVEFLAPAASQESDCLSKRFSPPRPSPPRPVKNISPPRYPVNTTPSKSVTPPELLAAGPRVCTAPRPQRKPTNQRSLYTA
ncbi:uncharacterized protein [Physcomitrium patens]|uniref:Uncharacterized protein n=1 Tax=Physcomitrium patens TaxID=3218 RepID=A0A2K1JP76_PHYPA|nr:uncharacterized protein LOC112290028 [Physcomitrium patens]XP_024391677.1 uncharacterized protein LOC112290028 [Physcomitrium patens]PNR43355.1 hypothetical protein PHYPA_015735 [Physcomitrium patens]|eukprot:XP_024391676.1 uncharacterized protein LOC112290028 [Physcomitrella patens]